MVNTSWFIFELIKERGSHSLHFFVFIHLVGTLSFFIWQLLIRLVSIGSSNGAKASLPLSSQGEESGQEATGSTVRPAYRTYKSYALEYMKVKKKTRHKRTRQK